MTKRKKKKILFVTTSLGCGGAERIIYLICEDLKENLDIKVICLSDGIYTSKIQNLGIEVFVLSVSSFFSFLSSFTKLVKLVQKFRPNIIQGWMYHGNLIAHVLRIFSPSSKLYLGIRQSLPTIKLEKALTRLIIQIDSLLSRFANLIIYNSYSGHEDHEKFGYKSESIVIPNGVDTNKFKPQRTAKNNLCKELKIPVKSLLIGLIARYHPIKNHSIFFEAASLIASTHPEVHFVLSGQDITWENSKLTNLFSQFKNLKNKVHLLGSVDNIESITSALDIAVNCSISEGMPNTVIEAMASGVIVAATNVGDSKRIINNPLLVTEKSSAKKLYNVCNEIIELAPTEKTKIKNDLLKTVKKNYSIESMISNYRKIYTDA